MSPSAWKATSSSPNSSVSANLAISTPSLNARNITSWTLGKSQTRTDPSLLAVAIYRLVLFTSKSVMKSPWPRRVASSWALSVCQILTLLMSEGGETYKSSAPDMIYFPVLSNATHEMVAPPANSSSRRPCPKTVLTCLKLSIYSLRLTS